MKDTPLSPSDTPEVRPQSALHDHTASSLEPTPTANQPGFVPQRNFSYTPPPKAPKPSYARADSLFAYLSIAVGFLFARTLPIAEHPLGATLFTWLLFAFGTAYAIVSRKKPTARTYLFGAVVCLLSSGFVTGGNLWLQRLLFLLVLAAFLYFSYTVYLPSDQKLFDKTLPQTALQACIVLPAASLSHLFGAMVLKRGENGGKIWRTLGWILLGLTFAIVPTAMIIGLLSYDEQFLNLLDRLFFVSLGEVGDYLADAIFGFLIAIGLFGALFGVKWAHARGKRAESAPADLHTVPRALLCAAVTPILTVYAIFFVSQRDYYLSAFTHTLPDGMTFAAYARSGFFELCAVCAINAVVLTLFHLLMRRRIGSRGLLQRIYSIVISLVTLLLIATALSKMLLYIDSYGLTQKRVLASWLMLALAAGFVLVLLKQLLPRISVALPAVICVVCLLACLLVPNIEGIIATYNVDAYLSGDLAEADVETLAGYGIPSIPALVKLERSLLERGELNSQERETLERVGVELDRLSVRVKESPSGFSFHLPAEQARTALKARG